MCPTKKRRLIPQKHVHSIAINKQMKKKQNKNKALAL